MNTTAELRNVRGIYGLHDSDIDDSEERDSIIDAVERGHVHRESHTGTVNGQIEDFVRLVEYDLPGSNETRFAIWRLQGDGLTYIEDSADRAPVEAAYVKEVRDMAEGCGYEWTVTDVDGLPADDEEAPDPEDERMTDAEFKVVREFLGLTGDWLAAHLGVSGRTVRHWEQGKYPIPDGVQVEMERLETVTRDFVIGIIDTLRDIPEPEVVTYRTDEEYHATHPEIPFPASWHRAVIARVAQQVPGLLIAYSSNTEQETA